MGRLIIVTFLILIIFCAVSCDREVKPKKIPIKVVVVTMFESGEDRGDAPGEFQYWVEGLPLSETLRFPQGYRDLRYNAEMGVLGIVTGVGNIKSSLSITALGFDERFDLTKAYWLVAGISGIDPRDAPTGSAVWAEWVVDGDLSHHIDAREIPEHWPTGYIPLRQSKPYELPLPLNKADVVAHLDTDLVEWAYQLTKEITLTDNEEIEAMRSRYINHPVSAMKPVVIKGDHLAASTYWHGKLNNDWANDWTDYWTEGKGNFVTSAMEDIGTYHALERLQKVGKVDLGRFLVLRTASNFTMQPPEISAYESLAGEKLEGNGYSAFIPSVEAAYRVGSPVVKALVENWDEYEFKMPKI